MTLSGVITVRPFYAVDGWLTGCTIEDRGHILTGISITEAERLFQEAVRQIQSEPKM